MKKLLLLLTFTAFIPVSWAQGTHSMHSSQSNHEEHHMTMPSEMKMENSISMDHKNFMHHQNESGSMSESDQAYMHINHTMHEGMAIEFTGNADIDFLKGMIPHHQGAVDMAKVQLSYGIDGTLKGFTQKVIRDQEREIEIMTRHLAALEKAHAGHKHHSISNLAFKKANREMHHDMNIEFTGNADMDFVNGMIPHHKGAVDMAWIVLRYGENPNVKRLAYDIINAQESEMTWMKRWLARLHLRKL